MITTMEAATMAFSDAIREGVNPEQALLAVDAVLELRGIAKGERLAIMRRMATVEIVLRRGPARRRRMPS